MSALSSAALASLIASQAEAHGASVLSQSGGTLLVALRLQRSSGRIIPFHLRIEAYSATPRVREEKPTRLPAFCPDRHLNPGGWFCLGYSPQEPQRVTDAESAAAWWRKVWKYLTLQEAAARLKRWPSDNEWAHGDAADHQAHAEACAKALGPAYVQALGRQRLKARRRDGFIQVLDGKTRLYSVWAKERRVATLRQRCVCGSAKPMAACGDHGLRAAGLAAALIEWKAAERQFWKDVRGKPCCGTLKDCPLKASASGTVAPALAA